jgi:DNA (cytosine-5)-methyltransferase 1
MHAPRYISLFTGAGGLDIGLERAGMHAVSLCEIEEVFCQTLQANQDATHSDGSEYFRHANIINADICEVPGRQLCGAEQIDLVVGGPPCQAFSSSGKQLSVLDPRGRLVNEFARVVDELKPKMFLFENVRGIVTARDASGEPGGVIEGLIDRFEELGYSCRAALLNAADYGAFQRRVRCFILASRKGTAPAFPEPTHRKDPDFLYQPWKTLEEFLKRYADSDPRNHSLPSEDLARELTPLPDGCGIKSPGKAEKTRPGGHWGYRQGTFIADKSLPARTVTGSASQDWVRWDGLLRRLTLQEVKLLQGFPADWTICGSKAQQYKQIGNAVPAIFGEILGRAICDFLRQFPDGAPKPIPLPDSFRESISYTKRDHSRNAESRGIHKHFEAAASAA